MKLSALKLSPSVISNLYTKTLVSTGDTIPPLIKANEQVISSEKDEAAPVSKDEILFLGENRKNILVAVNNNNVDFLPGDESAFLTNMLAACKLSIADTAIVNLRNINNPSYKLFFEKFKSNVVLLFGTDPAMLNLPVSFPEFQVQSFNNCTFLFTPSLKEIQEDKVLKSKLWVCLRRIFNV
jgi:hypothetical protein